MVVLLVACDGEKDLGTEAITTSKSGKIDVTVYPSDGGSKEQAELTPIVDVQDKDITDDGKGLYRIFFDTSGEGTVSVASTTVQSGDTLTVQAGTSVTVNVTPATDWKLNVCMLDWEFVQSNTFVMPEHDVTFLVSFVSKRHSISLGGSGDGYIITEGSDAVEGTNVEFSINGADLSTDGWYYEDEDVFVESSVENETGNRERVNVQKVGENRFRFVMPTFDCNIVMNRHNYGRIIDSPVYIPGNDAPIDNPADYLTYSFTVDGEPYTVGETAKRKQTIITITSLNPLYEIDYIQYGYSADWSNATKVDATHYSFNMGYGYLLIHLKDAEMPSGSHNVTLNSTTHGSISCSMPWAAAGDTVGITVAPDENYVLYTLEYSFTDEYGGLSVFGIYEQNGVYSFEMPDSDVEITATFRKDLDYDNLVSLGIEFFDNSDTMVDATTVVESIEINDENIAIADIILSYVVVNNNKIPYFVFFVQKNDNTGFTITLKDAYVLYDYEHYGDSYYYSNIYYSRTLAGNFNAGEDDIRLIIYFYNA